MSKILKWQILLGFILILLSFGFYLLHYIIFRDLHHIFIYLLGDIAFLFLEVLVVTIILHKLLNLYEKKRILDKLNMVVGVFFSEMGREFLSMLVDLDKSVDRIKQELLIENCWDQKTFSQKKTVFDKYEPDLYWDKSKMSILKEFLISKRSFLLGLLSNPNLMEHEKFTDLVWAILHFTEEISLRQDFNNLKDLDSKHLLNDLKRAYLNLLKQWFLYVRHLKTAYPYLFSLAVRTNPFDESAQVEVN